MPHDLPELKFPRLHVLPHRQHPVSRLRQPDAAGNRTDHFYAYVYARKAYARSMRTALHPVAAMRQYRFMALVMLDPAAGEEDARFGPGETSASCLIEPSYCTYFPALISLDREMPSRTKAHALVTMALRDGEARVFFAPGQRFTIWADAVVGHSVQAAGLAGHGVIFQCVSPLVPRLFRRKAVRRVASRACALVPGNFGQRPYRNSRGVRTS